MIYPSAQYKKLNTDLNSALKLLEGIPVDESPEVELDQLKLKSFVLLAHAAIEAYMEDVAIEAATSSRRAFKKGKVSKCIIALVSSCVAHEVSEKTKKAVCENLLRNLDVFSEDALNWFTTQVENNHGIKRNNQKTLFLPIGVDPENVDVSTYAALDAFGVLRGGYAHKFKIMENLLTVKQISLTVSSLHLGLAEYDKAVCKSVMKLSFVE